MKYSRYITGQMLAILNLHDRNRVIVRTLNEYVWNDTDLCIHNYLPHLLSTARSQTVSNWYQEQTHLSIIHLSSPPCTPRSAPRRPGLWGGPGCASRPGCGPG